jgi:hypothetical protein
VDDMKFFDAPFRKQILRQPGIDVIIFDEQNLDHSGYSML